MKFRAIVVSPKLKPSVIGSIDVHVRDGDGNLVRTWDRVFTTQGVFAGEFDLVRDQRDRETERQRDRETERQRDRETERQRDRETERQRDREADRQIDRKKDRQKVRLKYHNYFVTDSKC